MAESRELRELPTPALLVDRRRLARNLEGMARRAREAGIALRPHLKTAKCATIASLATEGFDGRITVSTPMEAAYFADHGHRDITYAVVVTPDKVARLGAIQRKTGARATLLTDDPALIPELDRAAGQAESKFRVLVEIDSGEHRTGLPSDAPDLIEAGRRLARASNLQLEGVLTHGGHAYACSSVDEIVQVAEQERLAVVQAAQRLSAAGFPCRTVSAGSTPTAVHARSFEGLTEIRPGVYMFYDLAQLGLGVCTAEDMALSVLASVIGHQERHGRLIVDAGGLALSKDTSANRLLPGAGYGWVADLETQARIADLRVAVADQEHGYVEGGIPYAELPVGSRVRIFPNHACMTAAAHENYWVVDGNEVVERWSRIGGW